MNTDTDWTTNPDGTQTRQCEGISQGWYKASRCPHHVVKPAVGRAPRYCSDACKQSAYRARKQLAEQEAARRAKQLRHEALERQVQSVVALELAGTKLSLTQQKALAERVTRALFLVDLVRNP